MNHKRQALLYGGLAVCAVFFGGDWAYRAFYESPRNELTSKTDELHKKVQDRRQKLKRAKTTANTLAAWEEQSLPANADVARSLYRAWLIQQVSQAGVVSANVDSGVPSNRRGAFQSLPFSVRGRATIDQLARFLYTFYRSKHLHQIQSLAITPIGGSGQLDVSISIEALILPGTDRTDRLAAGTAPKWEARRYDEFRTIARRNLFAAGGSLDPIAQTYLSGITTVDGHSEAWFDLRAAGRTARLRVGDVLDVGQFQGTVVDIDRLDVVLESEGQRWIVAVGENLEAAFPVPRLGPVSASR